MLPDRSESKPLQNGIPICGCATAGHVHPTREPLSNTAMAVVSTLSTEVEVGVEAKRLWLAQLDAATSLLVAGGGVVTSVEYESGHGEVGSIKVVKFGPAFTRATFSREVTEVVDHERLTTTYSVIGGELFEKQYSSYRGTLSFSPLQVEEGAPLHEDVGKAESRGPRNSGQPRTLVKWSLEYVPREGAETPEFAKVGVVRVLKALEDWLIANPELYSDGANASQAVQLQSL